MTEIKKRILILAILFCSMTFSATALAEDEKFVIISGGSWEVPSPLGYYLTSSDYFTMTLLFDTLTWKDADGVIPALADGWTVSDDGKTWTFYLNRNARWHDGELFTADDVKFTFDYMKDPPDGAFMWDLLVEHVEMVDVVDDYTVVIHLDKPVISFLVDTAGAIPIIPEHIWKDVSDPLKFGGDDAAAIGTGPMKLVEVNWYEANDDYFNGKLIVDKFASVPPGLDNNAVALITGQVDEASFRGSEIDAVRIFEGDPDFEIITGPSFWVLQVIFNCERYPTNILDFRRAVAYGIDREELVRRVLHGGGVVANTGIMHQDSIWYNPDCEGYEHDVDEANAILDSLGFIDTDNNGIREYPAGTERSGDLSFQLYVLPDYLPEAKIITYRLADIGIKIYIKITGVNGFGFVWGGNNIEFTVDDPSVLHARLRKGNFNMALCGHGELVNPICMNFPDWPASTYHSEEYTHLSEESESTMDLEERKELLHQLQEMIADDLPVYTLYNPYCWCVYNPDVLDTWFYTRDGVASGLPTELNKLAFLARHGDANENGKISMQDVTKIERMILELDETTEMADASQNGEISMQDVTHIELIILGRAPIRCNR